MGAGFWVVPWAAGALPVISRALRGLAVGCPGASWKEPSCGEGTEAPKLPGETTGRVWGGVLECGTMSVHQGSLDGIRESPSVRGHRTGKATWLHSTVGRGACRPADTPGPAGSGVLWMRWTGPGRLRSVPSSQGASIFVASLPMAPPRSGFSDAGVEAGRVQSGDAGHSQDTGDFKFQRKEPDVTFSSNYLLTEPWIFLGLSNTGCEQLWLWILQSVPNPPTISFSTEILFLASNSNPYQIWSLLYFSLFIQHSVSPSAVGDFLWSGSFSEIARLYQGSTHSV